MSNDAEGRESKILNMPQGRRATDAPQSGAHGTSSSPDTSNRHQPPQWVTSWPEWFDLGPLVNVTVVPKQDYDALAAELEVVRRARVGDAKAKDLEMECASRLYQEALQRASQAESALAAMKAERAGAGKWIPVSERLPEDGQEVRFVPISGYTFNGWYTFDRDGSGYPAFCRGTPGARRYSSYTPKVVRYWMPLPPAPTADEVKK